VPLDHVVPAFLDDLEQLRGLAPQVADERRMNLPGVPLQARQQIVECLEEIRRGVGGDAGEIG
jgi:hypothetical protein